MARNSEGAEVFDGRDDCCTGFIDMHVNLREPGAEYKETIASGVAAAVAGGGPASVNAPP